MKNKLLRFAVFSVTMIGTLYLAFMLLAIKNGNASEKAGENLLIAAFVGLTFSASRVFLSKFYKQPKE